MNSLTICVREWFESRYGNSYMTMRVVVDGADVLVTPMHYGHGQERALSIALDALAEVGYPLPAELEECRSKSCYWTLKNLGVSLVFDFVDVTRRKDLHRGGRLAKAESTLLWSAFASE